MADEWRYSITPQVWVPDSDVNLDAPQTRQGAPGGSTMAFGDTTLQLLGEAQRERWSVVGEFNALSASDGFTLGAGALGANPSLEGTVLSLGAGYEVFQDDRSRVQVIGGLRRWDLQSGNDTGAGRVTGDVSAIDPLLGLRVETPVGRRMMFQGQANLGGTDADSDRQIEAIAQIRVPLRDTMNLSAGYRYLNLNFGEDTTGQREALQGPFVSFSLDF